MNSVNEQINAKPSDIKYYTNIGVLNTEIPNIQIQA